MVQLPTTKMYFLHSHDFQKENKKAVKKYKVFAYGHRRHDALCPSHHHPLYMWCGTPDKTRSSLHGDAPWWNWDTTNKKIITQEPCSPKNGSSATCKKALSLYLTVTVMIPCPSGHHYHMWPGHLNTMTSMVKEPDNNRNTTTTYTNVFAKTKLKAPSHHIQLSRHPCLRLCVDWVYTITNHNIILFC